MMFLVLTPLSFCGGFILANKHPASFVLNPFCHGMESEGKQGSIVKVMAVSQGKQKKHVQAIQKQDIIQYFSSSGRHPATSCRAGPHSEHAAIFEETSTTTTNLSSAAFPPALITKHGYYMVQNIALVTLRPLYHLIYSQIIAVPSISCMEKALLLCKFLSEVAKRC